MISILLFFLSIANAQTPIDTTVTVVLAKYEKVESVQADVVIQAGQLISSNCEELAKGEGMPAFRLQMNSVTGSYMCVPETENKTISQKVKVDLGFVPNVVNVKAAINKISEQIRQQEGWGSAQPLARCNSDANGNVVPGSCSCVVDNNATSWIHSFDPSTKTCQLSHPDIMSFFVGDCSLQMRATIGFLEYAGVRIKSPYDMGVEFGMCTKWRSEDYLIPANDVIYKIFYASYMLSAITEELKKTNEFEDIKILVSQAEIDGLKPWSVTYAQQFAASAGAELISQSLEGNIAYKLEILPDAFQYMDELFVIE